MSDPNPSPEEKKLADFQAMMSHYESSLLRYASRLVHQHDAAQNIVQDTFIRLFRKWDEALVPCPKLTNWLYRVTHNCAIDYLRRESRMRFLHTRHATEQEPTVAPDCGKGSALTDEAEEAMRALRTLSLREQQLVILKVFEEKSYQEISEISGLTAGNVGYILHHAMRKMAAAMKQHGVK
jgi:RNA polymerase sigma-70 factor (ECF subfamily)